jgi:hypothetical protein
MGVASIHDTRESKGKFHRDLDAGRRGEVKEVEDVKESETGMVKGTGKPGRREKGLEWRRLRKEVSDADD